MRAMQLRTLALCALVAFGLALVAPSQAQAQSGGIDQQAARGMILNVGNDIIAKMNDTSLTEEQRRVFFTDVMLKYIDFRELGTRVLGRMARRSSEQQREQFFPLFATFFIDTVIDMLKTVSITEQRIGQIREFPNGEVIVSTLIVQSTGDNLDTGWRISNRTGDLKIVDVTVKGASAVGHFRDRMATGTAQNISGQIQRLTQVNSGSPTQAVVNANFGVK